MPRCTFTILEEHARQLRKLLLQDDSEYGALMLCGRSRHVDAWTGVVEERALVREVIALPEEAFLERTPASLTWSTTPLFQLAKRAMPKDQAICVAHSHPRGPLYFSTFDDVADTESFEIVFGRMETRRPHFSLVMDGSGEFMVRAFDADLKPRPVELTRVIGDRWQFRYFGRDDGLTPAEFDRQVRAFGATATRDLSQLRVAIVGCGGTGSAVASLLARMGVPYFVLIDTDYVDLTNLNRLHYSTRADAIGRVAKVDVLGDAIAAIGVARSVVRLRKNVDDTACRDALRSCDVIFGCTDDHLGRNLLNRLAHFYLIPVVDLGVLITRNDAAGYDSFDGRATVVQPGYPCQTCRKLIDPERMHEESLRRNDPERYEQYRRAGYVTAGEDPSPVVVTFTTEVATMAVNELLHRLTGYRGLGGHCSERVRRFDQVKDSDCVPGGLRRPECPLCGLRKYDGRGDMTPFLDQA